MGRLAREVELNQTANGKSVLRNAVAVSREYTNADGNYETDFIPIEVWGNTATNMAKFVSKGSEVVVQGRMQVRSYDRDGQKVWVTEVIADKVKFDTGGANGKTEDASDKPSTMGNLRAAQEAMLEFNDDDLPFM
jgi:single-strand DNA-binding protein